MWEDLDLDGLLFSSQAGYSDSGLPVPGLVELEAGGFELNLQPSVRHFPGAFGGLAWKSSSTFHTVCSLGALLAAPGRLGCPPATL